MPLYTIQGLAFSFPFLLEPEYVLSSHSPPYLPEFPFPINATLLWTSRGNYGEHTHISNGFTMQSFSIHVHP